MRLKARLFAPILMAGIMSTLSASTAPEELSLTLLEARLQEIDGRLGQLANYHLGGGVGAIGSRSNGYDTAEQDEWVEIEFGDVVPLDEIVLVPAIAIALVRAIALVIVIVLVWLSVRTCNCACACVCSYTGSSSCTVNSTCTCTCTCSCTCDCVCLYTFFTYTYTYTYTSNSTFTYTFIHVLRLFTCLLLLLLIRRLLLLFSSLHVYF
jgi:hypothetical protein